MEIGAKVLVNLQGKIMLGVLLKIMGKANAMDLQKVIFFSNRLIIILFKTFTQYFLNRPYVRKSQNDGITILDFRLIT